MTTTTDGFRARLGRFGVWLAPAPVLGATPAALEREQVARIEALGFGSVWVGEGAHGPKEIFAHLALLLAATDRLLVGSGIARVGNRTPAAMQAGAATLAEAFPGRLLLGLGVGITANTGDPQDPQVPAARATSDASPVAVMRRYLDAMTAAADTDAAAGGLAAPFPRLLAALGPRMLALARDHADGAHPFSVPVAHTALAREILGPDKLLVPEQVILDEPDPTAARALARRHLAAGSPTSPYARNLRRLGYGDDDFAHGGSDRLIDDRFAHGDPAALARRLTEHLDAGADSVLIRVPAPTLNAAVDTLARLADALPDAPAASLPQHI